MGSVVGCATAVGLTAAGKLPFDDRDGRRKRRAACTVQAVLGCVREPALVVNMPCCNRVVCSITTVPSEANLQCQHPKTVAGLIILSRRL